MEMVLNLPRVHSGHCLHMFSTLYSQKNQSEMNMFALSKRDPMFQLQYEKSSYWGTSNNGNGVESSEGAFGSLPPYVQHLIFTKNQSEMNMFASEKRDPMFQLQWLEKQYEKRFGLWGTVLPLKGLIVKK